MDFHIAGALNSSKMTSSMREPVSTSAVAMMVNEPPSSILRAAPKTASVCARHWHPRPRIESFPSAAARVVSASETSNGIEENDDIPLVFDHPLGLFADHFGDLNMALGRFVEGRANDFGPAAGAFHVGDFLGPFVNEQNEKISLRIVFEDGVGQLLHQNGLARARGATMRPRVPLQPDRPNRAPAWRVRRRPFPNMNRLLGKSGVRLSKCVLSLALSGVFLIHGLDLQQGKEALFFLRRPDLSGDEIAV